MSSPEKFEQSKFEKQPEVEKKEELVVKHERFGAETEETGKIPERFLNINKQELKENYFSYADKIEIQDLRYKIKEGKAFSLNTLLPEGWKLVKKAGAEFIADHDNKEVIYGNWYTLKREYFVPEGKPMPERVEDEYFFRDVYPEEKKIVEQKFFPAISRRGFFLILLHEIGHAHYYEGRDPIGKLAMHTIEREEIQKKLSKNLPLSEKEEEFKKKVIIPEERTSWAWALRTFRKLRQQGIDLEPGLPSTKEIRKIVHAALSTYEQNLNPEALRVALETTFGLEAITGESEK